jgi:hypothetical protein
MIPVAMSPVLHVEGCRTLLGSVVVHHQLSGSLVCLYVFVAFHLSIIIYVFSVVASSDALTLSSSSLSVLFARGLD